MNRFEMAIVICAIVVCIAIAWRPWAFSIDLIFVAGAFVGGVAVWLAGKREQEGR